MRVIVGPTLPEPYYGEVEDCWAAVEEQFGTHGVRNPYPHVTLYCLDDVDRDGAVDSDGEIDLDELESRLESVAERHDLFTVRSDGLGVFPGDHVWIPVAKSPALAELHGDVVESIMDLGTAPTPYYDPHRWFPHVGLALGFDSDTVGDVVTLLRNRDFAWEFSVDNLEITRLREGDDEYERVGSIDL